MSNSNRKTEPKYEYSSNLPQILAHARCSVLVSTYQSRKVFVIGTHAGKLDVSYLHYEQPMGIAVGPSIAIGDRSQVHFLSPQHDVIQADPNLGTRFDGCFVPAVSNHTGRILTHDLAWGSEGLWVVNTLFSCLCTLDSSSSFVPRWKPKFISDLKDEDRCHLNGMAIVDGSPRFVTALAETNSAAGWRPNKAQSGCVIDVSSGETICRSLSMPHSPRVNHGALWVLNSGIGGIGTIDITDGTYRNVESVPGFTRGLAIHGQFAFVGLSKIRESNVFGGLEIAQARTIVTEQQLDVLVFADVGMDALTSSLAWSRMAPVQCVTWGHPDTTGSPHIDYFLSSELLDSEDAQDHYTEKLIRLPGLEIYYDLPTLGKDPKQRANFGLSEADRVYACPQSLFKFHPDFDSFLNEILSRDPKGVLVVLEGRNPEWTRQLKTRWERTLRERTQQVRWLPMMPRDDYLALLACSDAMRDPIHFGGGNSILEAMAVCTPVITMQYDHLRSRIAAALLYASGSAKPLGSRDEYVQSALRSNRGYVSSAGRSSFQALGQPPTHVRTLEAAFDSLACSSLFFESDLMFTPLLLC